MKEIKWKEKWHERRNGIKREERGKRESEKENYNRRMKIKREKQE